MAKTNVLVVCIPPTLEQFLFESDLRNLYHVDGHRWAFKGLALRIEGDSLEVTLSKPPTPLTKNLVAELVDTYHASLLHWMEEGAEAVVVTVVYRYEAPDEDEEPQV